MKIEKVLGIIISDVNYGESSKVLNVFTKEHGRIGIISKGCRNLKSKLRSVSTKLTYGYFNIYYKEEGLSTLISVDILNELIKTKKDLIKIGCSAYLLDLTNQVLKQTNNKEIFPILISSIEKIEDGIDPLSITNVVELKYLKYLGVIPILECCSICNNSTDIITISSEAGGYICKKCYQNEYIVDPKTIILLRMYYYVDISKIKVFNIKDKNRTEINNFLENYYSRYTGVYLKSKNFLNQVRE